MGKDFFMTNCRNIPIKPIKTDYGSARKCYVLKNNSGIDIGILGAAPK